MYQSRTSSSGNIHVLSFHAYNPSSRLQAHLFLQRNFFRFSAPLLQYKELPHPPPPTPSGKRSICMQLCTCCFVITRLQLMLQQCWISSWSKIKCAFISLFLDVFYYHYCASHPPPPPLWYMPAQNPNELFLYRIFTVTISFIIKMCELFQKSFWSWLHKAFYDYENSLVLIQNNRLLFQNNI